MRWQQGKNDTLDIGWPAIQREFATIGEVQDVQVAGFDQVLFVVDGVKFSFYAAPRKRIATMQEIPYLNNIRLADVESIGVMKMEAMMRRSKSSPALENPSLKINLESIATAPHTLPI